MIGKPPGERSAHPFEVALEGVQIEEQGGGIDGGEGFAGGCGWPWLHDGAV